MSRIIMMAAIIAALYVGCPILADGSDFTGDGSYAKLKVEKINFSGTADPSGVIRLGLRGKDKYNQSVIKKLSVPSKCGRIRLSAEARSLKGSGTLSFVVRKKGASRNILRMDFHNTPEWPDPYAWVCYENGNLPTPTILGDILTFSQNSVIGDLKSRFDLTRYPAYADGRVMHREENDSESEEYILEISTSDGFACEVKNVRIDYLAIAPVEASISCTVWDSSPIFLDIRKNHEYPESLVNKKLSCFLARKSDGKKIWHSNVPLEAAKSLDISIKEPESDDNIQDYTLVLEIVDSSGKKIFVKSWDLWTLPRAIEEKVKSYTSTSSILDVASVKLEDFKKPFAYWGSDINKLRKGIEAPPEWKERRPRSLNGYQPSSCDGYIVFDNGLGNECFLYGPPEFPQNLLQVSQAFPGTRTSKIIGIYANKNLNDVNVEIDKSNLPMCLKDCIELRKMRFFPSGDASGYRMVEGPFVKPFAGDQPKGSNSYYAVILDLPKSLKDSGRFIVPLKISSNGQTKQYELYYELNNLQLPPSKWKFAMYSGVFGDATTRYKQYQDMRAMGMDSVILYNFSPCQIAYNKGKLEFDFTRFENELELIRNAGLLNSTFVLYMPFLEAEITRLSGKINAAPSLRNKDIKIIYGQPDTKPNYSRLEEELFGEVLKAIVERQKNSKLWPSTIWMLPQDEIAWKYRLEQTKRFGAIMKKYNIPVIATLDAVRWGWDSGERLDTVIDHRNYSMLNSDYLKRARLRNDDVSFYNQFEFLFHWVYYAQRIGPKTISHWSYWWPLGEFYQVGRPLRNAGPITAWPGYDGPLPTRSTLEMSQAIVDAKLLQLCYSLVKNSKNDKIWESVLIKILSEIPLDTHKLDQKIYSGDLPTGNAYVWREILVVCINDLSCSKQ